jgi:hypothetical protein
MTSQFSSDNKIDRRIVFEVLGRKMLEDDDYEVDYRKQGLAFVNDDVSDSSDSGKSNDNDEPLLEDDYG